MKYLSKIINFFKGNTVFFILLIAYLNSFVKNNIYFQTYTYITLGILLLIKAFHVVNLSWKTKKGLFLAIVQCFLLIFCSCLMLSKNIELLQATSPTQFCFLHGKHPLAKHQEFCCAFRYTFLN